MQHPFDQLAKQVGKEALDASGGTVIQHEISGNAHYADLRHDPDPARAEERARLGLLGRIAEILCLIEVFGRPPEGAALRACLGKHFAHWEEQARRARSRDRRRPRRHQAPEPVEPRLWIIAASFSTTMLQRLAATPDPAWPRGVYLVGGDLLRTGIVVGNELPRDRSTLLLRIMAAGALLPEAVADLAALPDDAIERAMAEPILLNLQHALGGKPSRTPEEEEFIVSMHSSWKDARAEGRSEGRAEGRSEGRSEGRAEEAARAVLTVLRVRGLPVPDATRERILAEKDPVTLERWHERAILAASAADLLDDPS